MSLGRVLVLGFLLLSIARPALLASVEPPGKELLQLTELVRFLKGRVRHEAPGLVTDPLVLARLLRAELERFDLVLPAGAEMDFATDDLKIAGVLLEEQQRRRRGVHRLEMLEEADVQLSREVEALLQDAEQYVPEFAPEIVDIFQSLRRERLLPTQAEPSVPHPASLLARKETVGKVSPAPATVTSPGSDVAVTTGNRAEPGPVASVPVSARLLPSPAPLSDHRYENLKKELQVALARPPDDWRPELDPLFGDRGFTVSSQPGAAPPVLPPSEPRPDRRTLVARLRERVVRRARLAEQTGAAPEVLAEEPPTAPAEPVTPTPEVPDRLVALMQHLRTELLPRVGSDQEFEAAASLTLQILGVEAPSRWRPARHASARELAAGFLGAGGRHLDGQQAESALLVLGL